jgi:hypothetical protein
MSPVLGSVAVVACLMCAQTPGPQKGSYLMHYGPGPDGQPRPVACPYVPQPGDLVFFDDHNKKWELLYKMVGSGPPFHSGLVIGLPDGTPAIIESGPDDTMWVRILALPSRLQGFEGDVWVRQVKQPLSPEQNAKLTEWALKQDGKHYALWRLLLQATPVRCRNAFQCSLFGCTHVDRNRWLCSELVVAGDTVAGLFDPKVHFANAIYPRDMIFDTKYDLSDKFHEARWFTAYPDRQPPSMTPR